MFIFHRSVYLKSLITEDNYQNKKLKFLIIIDQTVLITDTVCLMCYCYLYQNTSISNSIQIKISEHTGSIPSISCA